MAKRRKSNKVADFITKYPDHHVVVDVKSRRAISRGFGVAKAWRRLDAIASKKYLGMIRPKDGFDVAPIHTVIDDRIEAEMAGVRALRPLWHGRA